MDILQLGPYTRAEGTVPLPGSKSISNRVLLLAALAQGNTRIKHLLDADDTRVMGSALNALGVQCKKVHFQHSTHTIISGIHGVFPQATANLFLGNSGTAIRLLTATLAIQAMNHQANAAQYSLSGLPRMHERPIGDLVDSLRQIGAKIAYAKCKGFPPLKIQSAPFHTHDSGYTPSSIQGNVSSQFLSALLIALPMRNTTHSKPLELKVKGTLISQPYIEMTLQLMACFGIPVQHHAYQHFTIPSGRAYVSPGYITVEGDASSASYFLAAGVLGKGPVRVLGINRKSIQGEIEFTDALKQMGAEIRMGPNWVEARGRDILTAIDINCQRIPDTAMTLSIVALFANGASTLRNIGSWRIKESNRLIAMSTELQKLGAKVEIGRDYLHLIPPVTFNTDCIIDTYEDHRIAMCFSLISLAGISIKIRNPQCVTKTFPDYFKYFRAIVR